MCHLQSTFRLSCPLLAAVVVSCCLSVVVWATFSKSLKITVVIKDAHDFYDVPLQYDIALQSLLASLRVIYMNGSRFQPFIKRSKVLVVYS